MKNSYTRMDAIETILSYRFKREYPYELSNIRLIYLCHTGRDWYSDD